MNTVFNFICFISDGSWETFGPRPQLEPLAAKGKLIIVEAPLTIVSFANRKNWAYLFSNNRGRILNNGTVIIKPLVLIPSKVARNIPFLKFLYFNFIGQALKKHMEKNTVRVSLFFAPYQDFYIGQFQENLSTFDYCDKFDLYPNNTSQQRKITARNLNSMLKKVNVAYATSYLLKKVSKKINKNSFWIPNCVTKDFRRGGNEIPEDISSIKGPIVGFVGNINDWLDFELINFLAETNPHITFVFIGGIKGHSHGFSRSDHYKKSLCKKNIHYLGHKPYSDLYKYICAFDVCAIYYTVDEFKRYVHPNKIYMYLASGKPIVMTSFLPEAKKYFKKMVYVANSYETFNDSLKLALNERDDALRAKRIQFSEENNNLARCKKRFQIIEKYVERANHG